MSIFKKSPFSLPSSEYGGVRKRLFIGLMAGSCAFLCAFLILGWVVPYLGFSGIHPVLPFLSGLICAIMVLSLLWVCGGLVLHIATGRNLPGIRRIRDVVIRLMYPLMIILGRLVGIKRRDVRLSFVKVNNELVLAADLRVKSDELLILLPHCVQKSSCAHRLSYAGEGCKKCGLCPVAELTSLHERYGFKFAVATGGTIARRIVAEARPKLILAVACERDLVSGIQDSYPVPVYGLLNERPHGPCRDTLVNINRLEMLIRLFLDLPDSTLR